MFSDELAVARKVQVYAQQRRTRGNCPYLRIFSTGCRVSFLPAKGGKTFHVYLWSHQDGSMYLGEICKHRVDIRRFIRAYGKRSPRNLLVSLVEIFGQPYTGGE